MTQATESPFVFPASPEPSVDDPLTEVIRRGAKTLLAQAVEAEVEQWVPDIAQRCGFKYPTRFTATFTEAFGFPPTSYRQRHTRSRIARPR